MNIEDILSKPVVLSYRKEQRSISLCVLVHWYNNFWGGGGEGKQCLFLWCRITGLSAVKSFSWVSANSFVRYTHSN